MAIGTLYTIDRQPKGKTIRAAAVLGGLDIELAKDYKHMEDNKKPEFLQKFPLGKIPAFEDEHGFKLFEADSIARYLATLASNANLLGADPREAALVDQWTHLIEFELDSNRGAIMLLMRGDPTMPYNKVTRANLEQRLERTLLVLEAHLKARTFYVGERLTLADLVSASTLQVSLPNVIDPALREKIPNLVRHFETVVNHPKLKDIYGPTEFATKTMQFVAPAKAK